MELVEELFEIRPDNENLRWLKGIGLYKQGKYEESLQYLRKIKDDKQNYNYQIDHDIQMVEEVLAKQKVSSN